MARPELRALTGVRGIAAWLVVLYHLRLAAAPSLGQDLTAALGKGYLAVDLFFALSGFVLWLNYAERLRDAGRGAVLPFIARRIARIWPLHAAMLGVAAALALVLAATGRDSADYPAAELPLHLMLIQNWGLTEALSWNHPAWSISCEFAAYLLFPLFVAAVDWRRVPTPALLLAAAALALGCHVLFAALGHDRIGADIPRLGVARCLVSFVIGTIACALWQRWGERRMAAAAVAAGASLLAVALLAGAPETLLVPPLFGALVLLLALTSGWARNPFASKPIHYLGELSYATYLSHFLLFRLFKLGFVSDAANVPLSQIGVFLALLLPVSMLLYHGLERPAQRWLNARIALAPKQRTPAAVG